MKKVLLLILTAFVSGTSVYANDSKTTHEADGRTWDDGRPMTDYEHDHIQDVYMGGD